MKPRVNPQWKTDDDVEKKKKHDSIKNKLSVNETESIRMEERKASKLKF